MYLAVRTMPSSEGAPVADQAGALRDFEPWPLAQVACTSLENPSSFLSSLHVPRSVVFRFGGGGGGGGPAAEDTKVAILFGCK